MAGPPRRREGRHRPHLHRLCAVLRRGEKAAARSLRRRPLLEPSPLRHLSPLRHPLGGDASTSPRAGSSAQHPSARRSGVEQGRRGGARRTPCSAFCPGARRRTLARKGAEGLLVAPPAPERAAAAPSPPAPAARPRPCLASPGRERPADQILRRRISRAAPLALREAAEQGSRGAQAGRCCRGRRSRRGRSSAAAAPHRAAARRRAAPPLPTPTPCSRRHGSAAAAMDPPSHPTSLLPPRPASSAAARLCSSPAARGWGPFCSAPGMDGAPDRRSRRDRGRGRSGRRWKKEEEKEKEKRKRWGERRW
ncbi:unnamed protein product [Urochloa humidicola]